MSDTLTPPEPDDDRVVQLKRSQIRALEDQAKGRAEAERRAATAERQLAFAQAGIPLNDPKLSYFVRGYEGETTPEAIRQAAVEAGFIDEGAAGSGVPDAERQAQERLAAAATGAHPGTPPDLEAERNARLREAKTEAEFDRVFSEMGGRVAP